MRKSALVLIGLSCLLLLGYSAGVFYEGGKNNINLYKSTNSIDVSLTIDRLSSFFVFVISLVSLTVVVYSTDYVEHLGSELKKNLHVSLMSLFILSMVLVTCSANTFAFITFWEIMSISSFLLVMHEYGNEETRKAGLFYFIMTQLSTVFLMTAFLLLYNATGSFDIKHVYTKFVTDIDQGLVNIIFLLLLTGFAIKAGVVPFHKWLPYAHPASPSNISALMSGLMIKVPVYGMLRFFLEILTPQGWWGILILAFGAVSAILGVIYALKEHDIKRLLAYHSIENIGIILIGFGLSMIYFNNALEDLAFLCLVGSLFHTLNHAVFKSLLFLTAGSVVNITGERNIENLGGLIKKMPYTSLFFLIGAVSISGLPPFNGFVSEFMIFQGLLGSSGLSDPFLKILLLLCLSIFTLTSALAAACFVKAFGITFLARPRSEKAGKAHEAHGAMLAGPAVLAFLCAVLGLFSYQIFSAAGYNPPIPDILYIGLLLILFYAAAWAIVRLTAQTNERVVETWGCGIISQTCRTEYTASGFSEPIVTIFKDIYRTEKIMEASYHDRYKALHSGGHAGIRLMKFFEETLYAPIAKIINDASSRIDRLQNWNLDSYILYAFIAVILILVYTGWFI